MHASVTGKTHLAIAIARACVRDGARGRFFNVVDLVNKLEAEGRALRDGNVWNLSWSETFASISSPQCFGGFPVDATSSLTRVPQTEQQGPDTAHPQIVEDQDAQSVDPAEQPMHRVHVDHGLGGVLADTVPRADYVALA